MNFHFASLATFWWLSQFLLFFYLTTCTIEFSWFINYICFAFHTFWQTVVAPSPGLISGFLLALTASLLCSLLLVILQGVLPNLVAICTELIAMKLLYYRRKVALFAILNLYGLLLFFRALLIHAISAHFLLLLLDTLALRTYKVLFAILFLLG